MIWSDVIVIMLLCVYMRICAYRIGVRMEVYTKSLCV
jgi:hypothetical protein